MGQIRKTYFWMKKQRCKETNKNMYNKFKKEKRQKVLGFQDEHPSHSQSSHTNPAGTFPLD